MNTEKLNTYRAKVNAMPESTATEKARKEKALFHLNNASRDCGAFGKVDEILSKSKGSKARNYAKQGQVDCFVWVEGDDGKRHRYSAERKTNGGRIGALLTAKAPRFVVYSMDLCNSTTKGKRRTIDAKVIPTALFIEKLQEFNAIKQTNGEHNEPAIQCSSKRLFDWLSDYPVDYDPNETYYESDFEVE